MLIDKNKDLVTMKEAIDMKMLAEVLKQRLKRVVEIVSAKKDSGDEKKGKGSGGNDRVEKGGSGGQKKGKKVVAEMIETEMMVLVGRLRCTI